MLACGIPIFSASALDPSKVLMQYVHDRWGAEEGFVGGEVNAIAQSGDGYLWIGTERGLVRFDGESFRLLQQPIADQPAIGPVRQLVADGEGSVWARVDGRRLLRYRGGIFEDVVRTFDLPLMVFTAMSVDSGGGVLLTQLGNVTYRYRNGNVAKIRGMDDIPGNVIAIAETRDHTLWLGTSDHGLFRLEDVSLTQVGDPPERDVNVILPANNGGLWIGTSHGLDAWDGKTMLRRLCQPVAEKTADPLDFEGCRGKRLAGNQRRIGPYRRGRRGFAGNAVGRTGRADCYDIYRS